MKLCSMHNDLNLSGIYLIIKKKGIKKVFMMIDRLKYFTEMPSEGLFTPVNTGINAFKGINVKNRGGI